jgi:hypothetical protein
LFWHQRQLAQRMAASADFSLQSSIQSVNPGQGELP